MRSGVITLLVMAAAFGLFAWAAGVSVKERDEPCCPPGEVTAAPGESGPLSFWKDVYPVLESSCISCHGPSKARGGFRVDRREDYFGTGGQPPLVIPGRSAESPLFSIVSGARKDVAMPDRHRLPENHLAVVKRWIDSGASWPDRPEEK